MTGTELFSDALIELGYLRAGVALTANDQELVRRKFNRMIGVWNLQRRFVLYQKHQQFAWGASQQSYTIGVTADAPNFIITPGPRPPRLEQANLVLVASNPDVQLQLYNLQVGQFASLSVPALSAQIPTAIYYEPAVPNGIIYPWPYPTVTGNKLELWWWAPLAEIAEADVTAEYVLAPGYGEALVMSLAEQCLGRVFGIEDDPALRDRARQARLAIAGMNTQPPLISTVDYGVPSQGPRSSYNYLSGSNYPI